MNWEAIGAAAEMLGAFAVVVSIVYLATQVRVSTRQAKNAETLRFQEQFADLHRLSLTNRDHADLRLKLIRNERLTENEEMRAYSYASLLINIWGGAESAFHYGQISEPYYRNVMCQDVKNTIEGLPVIVKYLKNHLESDSYYAKVEIYRPIFEAIEKYKRETKLTGST